MGKPGKFVMLAAFAVFASSSSAWAQDIVSVRSGLIHHIEGAVTLEGKPVRVGNARFPTMAAGEVLEVQRGYAEVLLTPGAFHLQSPPSLVISRFLVAFHLRIGIIRTSDVFSRTGAGKILCGLLYHQVFFR